MTSSAPATAGKGLMRFSEALMPELLAFQRAAYPTRRDDWVESRWRWMFEGSARRLGLPPYVWLYRRDERIVAHQGAIAVRFKRGDEIVTTGWFVETMALESVRGKAIGPMLVAKALEELPFNLSLGQEPHMRELQFKLGWHLVAPLPTYAFVLRPSRVLARRVPVPGLRHLAGLGVGAVQRARWYRGRRRDSAGLRSAAIERFGEEADRLWARVSREIGCAVVRDASYLNWKYVEQPGQDYRCLGVWEGAELRGCAVFTILEPDEHYHHGRAMLTDLVVPPSEPSVVWRLLDEVRRASAAGGADLLVCDLLCHALQPQLLRFGFLEREARRFLLVSPGPEADAAGRLALEPAQWLLTRGDSDIDRPW
ncbi:MAG: hypothetical protein U0Q12_13325 [Vicinamibacterales bacterium]